MGHEFDHYPKRMIRDVKLWDWLLDEPSKESDDDEEFGKRKTRGGRGKRKKSEENEDDEWTGESEDDSELVGNLRKVQKEKYSARSKDRDRVRKDMKGSDKSIRKKTNDAGEDLKNVDEDEEDETLGGFIVGDDDMEQEEETADDDEEEDEEEEFVEEDDDDEGEG